MRGHIYIAAGVLDGAGDGAEAGATLYREFCSKIEWTGFRFLLNDLIRILRGGHSCTSPENQFTNTGMGPTKHADLWSYFSLRPLLLPRRPCFWTVVCGK